MKQLLIPAVVFLVLTTATTAQAGKTYKVERTRDIAYCGGADDADRERHLLDVYRPVGKGDFPVLFFVHGGGWMIGGKDDVLGIYGYGTIAEHLAERGLVVVVPNYRLSPKVQHPEHIKDIARAFAWTHRHVKEYGGRLDEVFVCGHSAGGHLVALLATNESYLKAEKLSAADIKAVIGISGVYQVDDFDFKLALGGCGIEWKAEVKPFTTVFGADPETIKQASPITHVRKGLPPFLLLYGGWDYSPIQRTTKDFAAALKEKDCDVEMKKVKWRTHETILVDLVHGVEPKTADAIIDFIERHSR